MTIRNYSTTPANNNAAPPNGWPEGQAASTVNDCARQMMAEVRETFEEAPYFDFGDTPTRIDNNTFTFPTDLTARYRVGARLKLVGATTGFGLITVSSHAAGTTTIDVLMESGNVPTSLTRVAVSNATLFKNAGATDAWGINPKVTSLDLQRTSAAGVIQDVMYAQALAGDAVTNVVFPCENVTSGLGPPFFVGLPVGSGINGVLAAIGVTATSAQACRFINQTAANFTIAVHNRAAAGDNSLVDFRTETTLLGTSRGSITYNRGGGLVAYNTTSDVRRKENIRDCQDSGDVIDAIRVRSFDWKDQPGSSQSYWVVAQELWRFAPWAVSRPDDEDTQDWGVDVSKLVPLLVKELQQLRARVAALESPLGIKA